MEEALKRGLLVSALALLLTLPCLAPGLAAAGKVPAGAQAPTSSTAVGIYAVVPVSLGGASIIAPYSPGGFLAVVGARLYSVDVDHLTLVSRQLGAVPALVASPGYPARSLLLVYPDGSAEAVDAETLAPLMRVAAPIVCQSSVSAAYNSSAVLVACAPSLYLYVPGRPRPITVARLPGATASTMLSVYPVLVLEPGGYHVGSLDRVVVVESSGDTSTLYLVDTATGNAARLARLRGRLAGLYLVRWGGGLDLVAASTSGTLLYARLGKPMYISRIELPFTPTRLWLAPTGTGYLAVLMDTEGRLAVYTVSPASVKLELLTAATTRPRIYTAIAWPLLEPVLIVPTGTTIRVMEPLTGNVISLVNPVGNLTIAVTPPDASYLVLAPPTGPVIIVRPLHAIIASGISTLNIDVEVIQPPGFKLKPAVYVRVECLSGACLAPGEAPVEAKSPLNAQLLPGLYRVEALVEAGGLRAPTPPVQVYLPPGREVKETVKVRLAVYRVCVRSAGDPYGWGFKTLPLASAKLLIESPEGARVGVAETGKDGCTNLILPRGGAWIVTASAKGYGASEVQLPAPGNYTISLPPRLQSLHIEAVSAATGEPVPGAAAVILDPSTKRRAQVPVPITLQLPEGEYIVTVFAKGYNPVNRKIKLVRPSRLAVRLTPSLVGLEILLQHGFVPLVSADIHITGYSLQGIRVTKTRKIRTDHVSLTIPPGIYEIRIDAPGFQPYSAIIDLRAPRLLRVNMKPLLTYLVLYLLHKYWRIIVAAITIPVASYIAYRVYKKLKPRLRKLIEKARKGRRKKGEEVSLEELLAGGGA